MVSSQGHSNAPVKWFNCSLRFVTYCQAATGDADKQQQENLIRNTVRCLVAILVTGRFFLTQILTQNRKFRYGLSSTKGKYSD